MKARGVSQGVQTNAKVERQNAKMPHHGDTEKNSERHREAGLFVARGVSQGVICSQGHETLAD
jgi:hypothetical protein